MCQGFVKTYGGLLTCRFFLGVFEVGVFPGEYRVLPNSLNELEMPTDCIVGATYLIGMYYKRFELQKRLVFFFSSSILAGAFGGVRARRFLARILQ